MFLAPIGAHDLAREYTNGAIFTHQNTISQGFLTLFFAEEF